jgi:hypothetical protein
VDSGKSNNVGSRLHRKRNENSTAEAFRSVERVDCHDLFENAFGHGAYVALDMSSKSSDFSSSSRRPRHASLGRDPIRRHQIKSTALGPHPRRRRFTTADSHRSLRARGFGDTISLTELHHHHVGLVSSPKYSACGNEITSANTSCHLQLWKDPDHAHRALIELQPHAGRKLDEIHL